MYGCALYEHVWKESFNMPDHSTLFGWAFEHGRTLSQGANIFTKGSKVFLDFREGLDLPSGDSMFHEQWNSVDITNEPQGTVTPRGCDHIDFADFVKRLFVPFPCPANW